MDNYDGRSFACLLAGDVKEVGGEKAVSDVAQEMLGVESWLAALSMNDETSAEFACYAITCEECLVQEMRRKKNLHDLSMALICLLACW